MPAFGERSNQRLARVHPDLQRLFRQVVITRDCAVLEGYRSPHRQAELLNAEPPKTKVAPGRSRHQGWDGSRIWTAADLLEGDRHLFPDLTVEVSLAVDVAPYYADHDPRVNWENRAEWYLFAGYVFRVAEELSIGVRWGGDWDSDWRTDDQSFNDLPHWELTQPTGTVHLT